MTMLDKANDKYGHRILTLAPSGRAQTMAYEAGAEIAPVHDVLG